MCCNRPFLFEGKYSLSWQHIDLLSTTIPLLLIIVFLTFFSFLRIVIIKFIVYIYIERSCADSLENAWYMSTLAFLDFCGISIQTMLYNMTGGTRLNRPSLCCRPRVSLGNPALFFVREKNLKLDLPTALLLIGSPSACNVSLWQKRKKKTYHYRLNFRCR